MSHKELFNYKCSYLRSVIEHTFGVWKNILKILRNMPTYAFKKQVKILIVTMVLHNYIIRYSQNHIILMKQWMSQVILLVNV